MAKNKSKKARKDATSSSADISHNPFAALADTRTVAAPVGVGAGSNEPSITEPSAKPLTGSDSPSTRFPNQIVIRREKKGRGGKTITRVSGVPATELASLAGEMKKALGCGATVENEDLVLLGSLVDRAARWLSDSGATKIVKGN